MLWYIASSAGVARTGVMAGFLKSFAIGPIVQEIHVTFNNVPRNACNTNAYHSSLPLHL